MKRGPEAESMPDYGTDTIDNVVCRSWGTDKCVTPDEDKGGSNKQGKARGRSNVYHWRGAQEGGITSPEGQGGGVTS